MAQSKKVDELVNRLTTSLNADNFSTPKTNEELLLNKLRGLVTNIKWSPEEAVDLFKALLKRFDESTTTNDTSHLLSWMLNMVHCIEIDCITPSWRCQQGKKLIELIQDKTVKDEDLKKRLADDTEKQLDEIIEEIRRQKENQIDERLLDDVRDIVSSFEKDPTLQNDGSQQSGLKKDLLKLCQAVQKTHFRPRLTQMVSWCIMALSETGRLIQVGTGEGKSCIVAMFAAFRALRGAKVDIMSSSSVLAERDLKEWRTFYEALNISVDCNTNKQVRDLKKCYDCQVVYGTVEDFCGDWLRHHFHRMDIFGERTFQCAIVDEVDSLMLDKGLHVVYLSDGMPAMQHLNPLLAFIWATAKQYSKIGADTTVGRKQPFHQVVLENMTKGTDVDEFTILQMAEDTGILAKGSVNDLRKNPSLLPEKTESVTAYQLVTFFETVERRFQSCHFTLHCMNDDGTIKELNNGPQEEAAERQTVPLLLTNGGFCQYMYSDTESVLRAAEVEINHALHFTPCEFSKDKICIVPGFLSELVNSKLKSWIENAFHAKTMTDDHEYIIEKHGIVPVDYSCTGVVENNMKWTDGLQQFIEMKHGCKLSDMTAVTNYMSTVGLLQKYRGQIFGISGTLGQQAETETLQKIYEGIKTCQIPSFKRRKLFEVDGVIVCEEKEWIEKICDVVIGQTNPTPYRGGRAVLVICETIGRAKVLHSALGEKVLHKKLYISNNMDNTAIFAMKLDAGDVIIATNLAGRGTDLQVSDQVKRAGGLFVVPTFLPKNARVEAQAFGRTARQGSPGSAQLIICSSHMSELLKVLALMGKLRSLFENIVDDISVQLFVLQFRSYQKSQSDEVSKSLALTALHILSETSDSGMKIVKDARNYSVKKSLARLSEYNIPKIKKKEELFIRYLDTLEDVYKSSNNEPKSSDLSALNEFWGLWLLTNFNKDDSVMDLKNKLTEDLKTARQALRQRESPSSNLHHYTAFGNELHKQGHVAESIKMYTKAIQEDKCWAAIAYYNRAFASLTQKDGQWDPTCMNQVLEDLQNALKSVELYCEQIEVTHRYSTQNKGLLGVSDTRFDNHIIARYKVLLIFKNNIIEAIKKVHRARDEGMNVKVEESSVDFMAPLIDRLPLAIVSIESLTSICSRNPLELLQFLGEPSVDTINELRCIESLGLTHVYTCTLRFSLVSWFSKILFRTTR